MEIPEITMDSTEMKEQVSNEKMDNEEDDDDEFGPDLTKDKWTERVEVEQKNHDDMMRFVGHLHNVVDGDEHGEDLHQDWWRWWLTIEAVKWSGEWHDEEPERLEHMLPGVDPKLITAAMLKELDKFRDLGVFEMIPKEEMQQDPNHILVGTRWVLVNKGTHEKKTQVKARLVAQ